MIMFRRGTFPLLVLLLLAVNLPVAAAQPADTSGGFADSAFARIWTRTDAPVADGSATRSWVWGEHPGEQRYELYRDAPQGSRLVQYFDKARMEINNPGGDRSAPWFVTNGLLVVEMISGRIQVGNDAFVEHSRADIPMVGDPLNNPNAPSYGALAPVATTQGNNAAPARLGERVSATYGAAGPGSEQPDLALPETEIVRYDEATGHNVPRVFDAFMNSSGPIIEQGRLTQGAMVDPLFAFGHPISEPYWTQAMIGGAAQWVLFQAFERRVLTYNPANPEGWRVEMGNVGQHYLRWRYSHALTYAQPPMPEGIRTRETTLEIMTYDYEQALIPTEPDDPVYPYPRLDREQVGEPRMQSYRALIVENRFLELTYLPEPGGRLYKVVNKATGRNIFYENPVIKPSPFGQRGWWLGVGGLEWAAPTEEHGYLEHLPWEMSQQRQGDGLSVRASITEQQTGMQVAGTVTLPADAGAFQVSMSVANVTDQPHPLQMWTNAMVAPGAPGAPASSSASNDISAGFSFVVPAEQLIVHAAQDSGVPAPGELMPWPHVDGRDMRYPVNWNGYVGAFAPQPVPFFGVYDSVLDTGAALVQGAGATGAKIFGFSSNFDHSLYTDDNSQYVELWSGAQPTFWDYPPIAPGATRAINSTWLPLHGLGSLTAASEGGALGVTTRESSTTVSLLPARIIPDAVVVVRVAGEEVFRSAPLDLRPDLPLSIDLPVSAEASQVQVEAPGLLLSGR